MNRREFAGAVLAAVGLGGVVGRGLLTAPKPKTFALGLKITRAMIEDDVTYRRNTELVRRMLIAHAKGA